MQVEGGYITNSWVRVANLPVATWGAQIVAGPHGAVYAFGGQGHSGVIRTEQRYDPTTNTWTILPRTPLYRWLGGAAVGADGRIYLVGGFAESDLPPATFHEIDREVDVWNPKTRRWFRAPGITYPRWQLGVGHYGGRIFAIGGCGHYRCPATGVDYLQPRRSHGASFAQLFKS